MLPQGEVSKNVPLCLEATSMLQKVFIEFAEKYGVSTRRRMKRGNGGGQTLLADVAGNIPIGARLAYFRGRRRRPWG